MPEPRKAPAEMNRTELEAQLETLHPESFGWALHCCGRDETEAEDVLQTAYLKILSGKARHSGRSSFKTWLFGVIRFTAMEARRGARNRERQVRNLKLLHSDRDSGSAPDPRTEVERRERTRQLVQALEHLSPRQREVLHLVFYQGLTIDEAARVMGISLGSARTHYERGKGRLRTLLARNETNERSATGS